MNQRYIAPTSRRELDRQESAEFYLVFLTITHRSLTTPIRVVCDPENFVLDGQEFQGFDFEIKLLTDSESAPKAQLSVQNVDRKIGDAIHSISDPARLEFQIIPGSEFDLSVFPRVELSPNSSERLYRAKQLYLTEVEGDALNLTGTIRSWDYTQETWPGIRATQQRFPGLFW